MKQLTVNEFMKTVHLLTTRDGAVEICAVHEDTDAPGTTFKTRVLAVEESGDMLLEVPAAPAANQELIRGKQATVLSADDRQRQIGFTRIEGIEFYKLNEQRRVRALRLSRPTRAESAQRREFFRVSAGASLDEPVTLRMFLPDRSSKPQSLCNRTRKTFLHNLSGGGLGVTMKRAHDFVEDLRSSVFFLASIPLPGQEQKLEVKVKLVHLQSMPDEALYLGLEFQLDDEAEQRDVQDRVVRATTELQRRQLRRQRGA